LPVAIVAAAYIIGQGLVDTWGDSGAAEEKEKHDGWVIVSDESQRQLVQTLF
jgi:hypothetical protein